jgi:hypothetical protein
MVTLRAVCTIQASSGCGVTPATWTFRLPNLLLVQHCMGERVAGQLARHFSARRVRVQAYDGPRHHYPVPRRWGTARQGIAAHVPLVTTANCP